MPEADLADLFAGWKQAWQYLDRVWGSELVKVNMSNPDIIQLVERGKRYLKYLDLKRERNLPNSNTIYLEVVTEIINNWEQLNAKKNLNNGR